MQTFQIGKTYQTSFACDFDSKLNMTVISRTAKTIVAKVDSFGVKTLRVSDKYTPGVEQVSPLGSYSMAPRIGADDLIN
jgi:hypothetical protein